MSTSFLVCVVVALIAVVFWRATLLIAAATLIAILITGIDTIADHMPTAQVSTIANWSDHTGEG